jgi:hypothetical protein
VVTLDEVPPGAVSEVGCLGSRTDDVGEHDGRQHAVEDRLLVADPLHEPSHLLDDPIRAGPERQPLGRRDLHTFCGGNHRCRVPGLPDSVVGGRMEEKGRDLQRGHRPDVGTPEGSVYRRRGTGARYRPEHAGDALDRRSVEGNVRCGFA